jgi:hypothetical protein
MAVNKKVKERITRQAVKATPHINQGKGATSVPRQSTTITHGYLKY